MTVGEALALLTALLQNASQISTLIGAANAAGRSTLNANEWAAILAADDTARSLLVQAIAAAAGGARGKPEPPPG